MMMSAQHRSECAQCHDQIAPGEKITRDEAGDWIHAEGCTIETETWVGGLFTGQTRSLPGYRGARPAAPCPRCHLSPCDCDRD